MNEDSGIGPDADDEEEEPDIEEQALSTLKVALYMAAFAGIFVGLHFAVPWAYHGVQPSDHYISADPPSIEGTGETHCDVRLSSSVYTRDGLVVDVETTLYQREDEALSEVSTWREETYLPEGVTELRFSRSTHQPLSNGTYLYRFEIRFQSPYGWDKQYDVESEPFRVHHGNKDTHIPGITDFWVPADGRC